jgi:1-deoxy-D-xylulose-5-phosphate reductoisomerase
MVKVAIAGSTGSIGTQTLDVVRAEAEHFEIVGLSAGRDVGTLIEQARSLRATVTVVAIADERRRGAVADALPWCDVVDDVSEIVGPADVVVNGVVGFAGLGVTVATLASGKRLALANKESLIAGAPVVQPLRQTPGAELVPVDSEHCAIHQCLRSSRHRHGGPELSRIILTASGGPFRGRRVSDLAGITVDDALAHPTWKMGPKITVDSSTLMNKGLEVIEAHELFGAGYDEIDVVVHPQSVVHSMVEFSDGSTIAQLSMPDMRLPIGYALAYPDRVGTPFGRIDWSELRRLDFEQPDRATFRCLDLAYQAGRAGGSAPAWLNAANEVVVDRFLAGGLAWLDIAPLLADVLDRHEPVELATVSDVIALDARARATARSLLERRT